ncbi:ATP-binding protein [Kitasatospora sp. NPDC057015]|uniref:ATP-binding protein n=1 Tax=Kitasatospora sp. NPDC057015 TaxID=3346001 RepID=UPI00362BC504
MSDSADISFLSRATWAIPSAPSEVAGVRIRAVAEVRSLGIPLEDSSDLELVVTELVTNAIRHGEGPEVHIHLRLHRPGILVVEVHDRSRAHPDGPPSVGDEQESGRGLHIVDALALRWGFLEFQHHKAAWAHLAVPTGGTLPARLTGRRPASPPRADPGPSGFSRRVARTRACLVRARDALPRPWPVAPPSEPGSLRAGGRHTADAAHRARTAPPLRRGTAPAAGRREPARGRTALRGGAAAPGAVTYPPRAVTPPTPTVAQPAPAAPPVRR